MTDTTTPETLAETIVLAHQTAREATDQAKSAISTAFEASRAASAIVDAAKAQHGRRLKQWWEATLPIPWQDADRYRKIYRVAGKPGEGDKRQMQLIGLMPTPETRRIADTRPRWQWVRQAAILTRAIHAGANEALPPVVVMSAVATLRTLRDACDSAIEKILANSQK
jgi:hypothetical protein